VPARMAGVWGRERGGRRGRRHREEASIPRAPTVYVGLLRATQHARHAARRAAAHTRWQNRATMDSDSRPAHLLFVWHKQHQIIDARGREVAADLLMDAGTEKEGGGN
jgi:hypothetical protein